jgi:hypothetical protein
VALPSRAARPARSACRWTAIFCILGCALPATVQAIDPATLTRDPDGALHLLAAPGARDNLAIGFVDDVLVIGTLGGPTGPNVEIADSYFTTSSIAGSSCNMLVSGYGQLIRCPTDDPRLRIDLGDQSDHVTASVPASVLGQVDIGYLSYILSTYGSPCRGRTDSHGESVTIDGGAGGDVIRGSPGQDLITGGVGDDRIDGGPGSDQIYGGLGADEVAYCDRAAAVDVSLDDLADDGSSGEADNVHLDIERITGGTGNDRLVGSETVNALSGGEGADYIDGKSGNDTLDGGAGDDTLLARDTSIDRADCGTGSADRADVDALDQSIDCEFVDRPPLPDIDGDDDLSPRPFDCDDGSPSIRPGAFDVPEDKVDQDCDGRDAMNLDRDHDGSLRPADCNDRNPRVHPRRKEIRGNQTDEDCNGIAAPFARVAAVIQAGFARTQRRISRLELTDLSRGSTVTITCRAPHCPTRLQIRARHHYKRLDLLARYRNARFNPGARFTVCIVKPMAIGKLVRYRFGIRPDPKTEEPFVSALGPRPKACR